MLLTVVVSVGLLVAFRYLPVVRDGLALRDDLRTLVGKVREAGVEMEQRELDELRAEVVDAIERHGRIAAVLSSDPLVALARALPVAGRQVVAGDDLVAAAGLLLEVVDDGLGVADEVIAIRDEAGGSRIEAAVRLLATSRDTLADSVARIERAEAFLRDVPADATDVLVRARDEALENLVSYRPLLSDAVTASDVVPPLLGWDRPVRYLVLAQNPAELRPTGGYIGSFGLVELERGRISAMDFRDVSTIDQQPELPYVEPPAPLRDHLLGDTSWRVADSNWSPDGPTAAQAALQMYEAQTGDRADGAILLTTDAIDELLALVGPVTVPPDGTVVEAGEATFSITAATRQAEAGGDRKAFIGRFADVLLDELLALPVSAWPEVPDALDAIRGGHSASVWVRDPALQARIDAIGWSGSLGVVPGDEVRIVEANVGPVSKLHLVTERAVTLDVELTPDGFAHHILSLAWRNRIRDDDPAVEPIARMLLDYQDRDELGVYVRTLVPEGSAITEAEVWGESTVGGLEAQGVELGRTSFGAYLLVPPGTSGLRLGWVSPAGIRRGEDGWTYRLQVPKHPGRRGDALEITIRLPPGTRLAGALPTVEGQEVWQEGDAIRVSGRITADVIVEFALAPT